VVADLRDDGTVERGWLGVQIQEIDEELATALGLGEPQGVLIADVTAGGPADEAGLEPGDVVISIAGETFEEPRELSRAVADLAQGETVTASVLRDGEEREIGITIGLRPDLMARASEDAMPDGDGQDAGPRIGVAVAPLTPELRAQASIPAEVTGVFVQRVQPGSPAAEAAIMPSDVIVSAGGRAVDSVEALRDAVAEAAGADEPMLVRLYRRQSYAFVTVDVPEAREGN
jgi:serine protease Do